MTSAPTAAAAEVFSVREIARAAEVSVKEVRSAVDRLGLRPIQGYLPAAEAIRCVECLQRPSSTREHQEMFASRPTGGRLSPAGLAASGTLHLAGFVALLIIAALELPETIVELPRNRELPRLVFLPTPGPGGGGGGGGLRQTPPPPKAEMTGAAKLKSPVPPPKPFTTRKPEPARRPQPAPPRPTPEPPRAEPPPPPPRPELTPQVVAPVVTASADPLDRAGVLTESATVTESQGAGSGGGVGSGRGTGLGEGTGAGIGPGTGGGTGGGPYRAGSGISAPGLLHEVRPEYTEDARRRGIEGDVILEIVVRRDGSVGDVKVVQGLGGGLERRAVEAVRQWRFSPARRQGTPVDVLVEVAVEFKLR